MVETTTKLTKAEKRCLEVVRKNPGLRAAYIGEMLWGRCYRLPQYYARPAGKVLHRLARLGLICRLSDQHGFNWVAFTDHD